MYGGMEEEENVYIFRASGREPTLGEGDVFESSRLCLICD